MHRKTQSDPGVFKVTEPIVSGAFSIRSSEEKKTSIYLFLESSFFFSSSGRFVSAFSKRLAKNRFFACCMSRAFRPCRIDSLSVDDLENLPAIASMLDPDAVPDSAPDADNAVDSEGDKGIPEHPDSPPAEAPDADPLISGFDADPRRGGGEANALDSKRGKAWVMVEDEGDGKDEEDGEDEGDREEAGTRALADWLSKRVLVVVEKMAG